MAGTHVAFVRGINVGRAKRVAMSALRGVLEALGHRDVRTLLNSGNAVFTCDRADPDRIASEIEGAVLARLGVSARVVVLTRAELLGVVSENPLRAVARDPTRLIVSLCRDAAALRAVRRLEREDRGDEALATGPLAAYLWCPKGILASALAPAVGRLMGESATSRNLATLSKVEACLREAPPNGPSRKGSSR